MTRHVHVMTFLTRYNYSVFLKSTGQINRTSSLTHILRWIDTAESRIGKRSRYVADGNGDVVRIQKENKYI